MKQATRTRDRRPEQVPHHPGVLTVAWVVTGAALVLMMGWFWSVMSSKGFILTAEQQNAAANQAATNAEEDAAAEADQTQADRDRQAEAQSQQQDTTTSQKGGPPPAPDVSDTTTFQWELNNWSILSVNGVLNVSGELENITDQALTGTVKTYVYIDGVPVATAKTDVVNFKPGETQKVDLVSDSDWEPGEKVLLLQFAPRK